MSTEICASCKGVIHDPEEAVLAQHLLLQAKEETRRKYAMTDGEASKCPTCGYYNHKFSDCAELLKAGWLNLPGAWWQHELFPNKSCRSDEAALIQSVIARAEAAESRVRELETTLTILSSGKDP